MQMASISQWVAAWKRANSAAWRGLDRPSLKAASPRRRMGSCEGAKRSAGAKHVSHAKPLIYDFGDLSVAARSPSETRRSGAVSKEIQWFWRPKYNAQSEAKYNAQSEAKVSGFRVFDSSRIRAGFIVESLFPIVGEGSTRLPRRPSRATS